MPPRPMSTTLPRVSKVVSIRRRTAAAGDSWTGVVLGGGHNFDFRFQGFQISDFRFDFGFEVRRIIAAICCGAVEYEVRKYESALDASPLLTSASLPPHLLFSLSPARYGLLATDYSLPTTGY